MSYYQSLESIIADLAEMIRPPKRMTVSQSAEEYRYLKNEGSYVGEWDNKIAPYLVEPMDTLQSLDFVGEVFVGPARTGKSDMFFNWLCHTAICDPADMTVYQMTMNSARDWSSTDLARCFRHSEKLGEKLARGRQNDNVHDKTFSNGMKLLIKWPAITEMSGKTFPRGWLMDFDRMPQDVDGEGNPFDLASKRNQTFNQGRNKFGMTMAESSPGFDVEDPQWIASSPHEAPPTQGILALYNRGDRRRWNWQCPQCRHSFEPDFSLLQWPDSKDHMEAAEQVCMVCPHDGFPMDPSFKKELNLGGRWVKDGQIWMPDNTLVGTPRKSDIASFWMKGPAAAFQTWQALVLKHLQATEEYEKTGSEQALKTTVNVDQGNAYTPKAMETERLPEHIKSRAYDWGGSPEEPVVPDHVRALITTVDVQKKSFVVQVHGLGEGGDLSIVDTFKIRKSNRLNDQNEREILDPGGYLEDWDLLIDQVILRTYPLVDGSGRRMSVKAVGCDSGGKAGVTANAYRFWRRLRDDPEGRNLHRRFQLVKGEHSKTAPRIRIDYPDSQRKDRHAGNRGDVPVLFINSTPVKDMVSAMLGRTDPGGGMIHFPTWLPDWFYQQLTAEVRTPMKWENKAGRRNEAWDCLYYCVAILMNGRQVSPSVERIDWQNPPGWLAPWDRNDLVFGPKITQQLDFHQTRDIDLETLGSSLA